MLPLKPLARVLTKVVWIAGGSIVKATLRAYREAVAQGNIPISPVLRRHMLPEEAAKILGFPTYRGLQLSQIEKAHQRLRSINMTSKSFPGSPYLVERIDDAEATLRRELSKP